ncbi:MAG TPA: tripartite tricarboxylate transporter TctB family protein [Burkholderiales bacterium]|nr:tripartite tricarboxylate transporter TctB family protein [Burkholderiales bacterium]
MGDRVVFVCTIALAGFYFYFTSQIPSSAVGDPLGPRAFPDLLGIGLLICAGLLAGEMMRAKRKAATVIPVVRERTSGRHLLTVTGVCVWFALYTVCYNPLGFIVSTGVFLLGLMIYFNRRHWITNILVSVLFSAGTYALFDKALSVPLPGGLISF